MHQIDITKGERKGEVSRQWANRPEDQRFTSIDALLAQTKAWAEASHTKTVTPRQIEIMADATTGTKMGLTHYSFERIAAMAAAPANYLRRVPAQLAALNLNYGLRAAEQKDQSLYLRADGDDTLLRGITSTRYGRILDMDVVKAVQGIAGNGTGDTRWKVPGTIDWGGAHGIAYNPNVDITSQNTTLYASDRDVFMFLVDDFNPIEVGKLANGAPDLMFRGFYVWNSEVGDKTFGVATMYLRGVCQNRNLWGVEGFNEVTFRHTAGAPDRFLTEAAPALATFTEGSTSKLIAGVTAAKQAIVSKTDEERLTFLGDLGFSIKASEALIQTSIAEEGRAPESVWDHAQAITAFARTVPTQEARIKTEQIAGKLLDKVAA